MTTTPEYPAFFDKKGLVYGMGHAVYSLSDPRERVFRSYVEALAKEKGRERDLMLYEKTKEIINILINNGANIKQEDINKVKQLIIDNLSDISDDIQDEFEVMENLYKLLRFKKSQQSIAENALFETNGAMVDMSRNAVMNVPTVKMMLRKMALMGMNMYMLYTEDTYEVEDHPYFGYMRGRYSMEEIKEIDAYAISKGMELIPCIQTLGHFTALLNLPVYRHLRDADDVILAGSEEVYDLIDKIFSSISKCFTSKTINIGLDEAHSVPLPAYPAYFVMQHWPSRASLSLS